MIKELEGHISNNEIKIIVQTILNQYRKYLDLSYDKRFKEIFAEEYSAHRKKHNLSWAIVSSFREYQTVASRFQVDVNCDKGNHRRPELICDTLVMFVLSDTTDFEAKYLKAKYKYNSQNFSGKQLFCYIKFTERNERLLELSICLPDEKGLVVKQEVLIDEPYLSRFVA